MHCRRQSSSLVNSTDLYWCGIGPGARIQKDSSPAQAFGMSFFSFGQSAEIDIVLNDAETRKKAEHKTEDGKKDKYFLFYDGETVSGKVNVTMKNPGKRLEHQGIKIEFIGQIGKLQRLNERCLVTQRMCCVVTVKYNSFTFVFVCLEVSRIPLFWEARFIKGTQITCKYVEVSNYKR